MGEGDCGNCNGCDCGSGLRHEIIEYGRRLERAWSRETAAPSCQDRWTRENNALGQGAVTALLIQDKFGGDLIRTEVAGHGSHYFNRLPNGCTVDFTIQQFPDGAPQAPQGSPLRRIYVFIFPSPRVSASISSYARLHGPEKNRVAARPSRR